MPEASKSARVLRFARVALGWPIRHTEWAQKFNRRAAADKNRCT